MQRSASLRALRLSFPSLPVSAISSSWSTGSYVQRFSRVSHLIDPLGAGPCLIEVCFSLQACHRSLSRSGTKLPRYKEILTNCANRKTYKPSGLLVRAMTELGNNNLRPWTRAFPASNLKMRLVDRGILSKDIPGRQPRYPSKARLAKKPANQP